MDTEQLRQWCTENNIESRTKEHFWQYFSEYKKANDDYISKYFGEIDERLIYINLNKVQLTHIFDYGDFVYSLLDIHYNGMHFGTYKGVFTIEGEDADDFLDLKDSQYMIRHVIESNLSVKIAENLLRMGADQEIVAKSIELEEDVIKNLGII